MRIHDSHIFCLTEDFADQQKKLRENIVAKITVHDLVKLLRNRRIGENETGEVAVSKNTSWKELIGVAAVTGIAAVALKKGVDKGAAKT